jgi:hypothetical protein
LTRCKMRRSGDYVDSGEGWARPAGRGKAFVWLIRPKRALIAAAFGDRDGDGGRVHIAPDVVYVLGHDGPPSFERVGLQRRAYCSGPAGAPVVPS